MTAKAKRAAWRLGAAAETAAAWSLRLRGYRILARRFRTPVGEIDIVAGRGRLLAMIEVKARRDHAAAAEAITAAQRRRIMRAARAFIAARPRYADRDIRFDAILVTPWRLPRHVPDAWREE